MHSRLYVVGMLACFGLNASSTVVERAAYYGYLLQYVREKLIPCYGIEPTTSTANAIRQKVIEIVQDFLSTSVVQDLHHANQTTDLLVANNVIGHVPDINDFSNVY